MPDAGMRADAPPPGWLLVDAGGTIRRADAAACTLLGLAETGTVLGREVRSLVARGDRPRWPEPAPGPGQTWNGTLRFEVAETTAALAVEMVGLVTGEGWAMRLATPAGGAPSDSETIPVSRAAANAPLAAADAIEESETATAAIRAVLQALDAEMPFDFGCVLRFVGGGALVTVAYPTAMAGVASGEAWARLDDAEVSVRERGEPGIDGDLAPNESGVTPLRRLPAFGMRSRLHVPLFAQSEVAGVAILYRRQARAFSAGDGWLAERTLRRLGNRLRAPITPALAAGGGAEGDTVTAARFDALGDLVAGVAHELNNPLTSILGYAQILDTLEGVDREHALHTIEEESQRAARIMRNLLQFARSDPNEPSPPAGVQLPLVQDQPPRRLATTPEAHEPVPAPSSQPGSAGRLLVIEENPAIRLLASEILAGAGFEVSTASDGAQGVLLLAGGGYDAVIADYGMRGLDVSTLADWILAHTRDLRHRLIFMSDDQERERMPLPPEVTALYLQKPFDVDALLSAVNQVLGPSRKR